MGNLNYRSLNWWSAPQFWANFAQHFWWNLRPLPVWNRKKKPSLHFKVYTLGLGPSFKQISYLGVGKLEETFTKKHAPKPSKNLQSQQLPQLPRHHLTGTTGTFNWKESSFPTFQVTRLSMQSDPSTSRGSIGHLQILAGRWGGWVGGGGNSQPCCSWRRWWSLRTLNVMKHVTRQFFWCPFLGWWFVTVSNGESWPPTGGWKGHFESPGMYIWAMYYNF